MTQRLQRWVRWALGDLPSPRAPEPGSASIVVFLVIVTTLAMLVGEVHKFRGDPLPKGAWRALVHGGLPLVSIALYEAARARRGLAFAVTGALPVVGIVLARVFVLERFTWLPGRPEVVLAFGAWALGWSLLALREAGVDRSRWALGLGDVAWWGPRTLLALVVMVPVLAAVVLASPGLQDFYPMWKPAQSAWDKLVLNNLGLTLDFIGWEMLFRGFLLQGVMRRGDAVTAICLQTIPFCLLHADKPGVELVASLFGGLVSGWFCLRAGTFLPLWILHSVMISTVGTVAFLLR